MTGALRVGGRSGTLRAVELLLIDDVAFDRHRSPREHFERPERIAAARAGVADGLAGRLAERLSPDEVTRDLASLAHTEEHVSLAFSLDERHRQLDPDTYTGPGTREAVLKAAGAGAKLGDSLARGARRAIALVRPPGHHAEPGRPMGFCVLNNVAIAALAARRSGARRIAIIDWDVHHGNGTQAIFERDPDTLFISLHQWPIYPGTGAPEEVGIGAGLGATINLALPPGCGGGEYAAAFNDVVLPAVEAHAPDAILVSCGLDAHERDPLGSMRLRAGDFGFMTSELAALADRSDIGLGVVMEGGYDLVGIQSGFGAVTAALLGERFEASPGTSPAAQRAIDMTVRALRGVRPELTRQRPHAR